MSRILGLGTALPEHRLSPEQAQAALGLTWPHLRHQEMHLGSRFTVDPAELVFSRRSLGTRMAVYAAQAPRLAEVAAREALAHAGLSSDAVDVVISVSCTGYMAPSLDVRLAKALPLKSQVIRLPITELGCSGGAAGLALAHRMVDSGRVGLALVVCVELCSLSFHPDDRSADNLAAALVFGDGASAAVVGATGPGPLVERVESHLIADSEDLLGFQLRDDGFHPVLDRRLPRLIERALPQVLREFGAPESDFLAVHAGGPRIFDAVESALGLAPGGLVVSRDVFARFGNLSSASLFFVMAAAPSAWGQGLSLAFGPGVTVELAELRRSPE